MRVALLIAVLNSILPAQEQPAFLSAEDCALCHVRLAPPAAAKGPQPTAIGQFPLWRTSMMSRAARDPYWQARVDLEIRQNPALKKTIHAKCHSCHAPAGPAKEVAAQGVGCTVCHQIPAGADKLIFSSKKEIYGPHERPFEMPMLHHTGFTPVASAHIQKSELCAVCHTVKTPILDSAGNSKGEFLEQAPYLEWRASSYPALEVTCQSCHVPALEDKGGKPLALHIAHRPPGGPFPPTRPRSPFGLHYFAGANLLIPAILGESAPRTRDMLESAVALEVEASRKDSGLDLRVTVRNLTGHKLPTGFPSRRLWIHLRVEDSGGRPVFESGAWDPSTGELTAGAATQSHHRTIDRPNQVMVYEAELADSSGKPTTSVLRAASYAKDNRLLPDGFDRKAASVAPVGVDADSDFTGGSDTILYRIAKAPPAALTLRAQACYQTLRPAHTEGLDPEFVSKYRAHANPACAAAQILREDSGKWLKVQDIPAGNQAATLVRGGSSN